MAFHQTNQHGFPNSRSAVHDNRHLTMAMAQSGAPTHAAQQPAVNHEPYRNHSANSSTSSNASSALQGYLGNVDVNRAKNQFDAAGRRLAGRDEDLEEVVIDDSDRAESDGHFPNRTDTATTLAGTPSLGEKKVGGAPSLAAGHNNNGPSVAAGGITRDEQGRLDLLHYFRADKEERLAAMEAVKKEMRRKTRAHMMEEGMDDKQINLQEEAMNRIGTKKLGVVFEHLNVQGSGGINMTIPTFPQDLASLLIGPIMPLLAKMKKPEPKTILHDFSGFLKPGEMCLVLGRPGAGCSTFLKTIANRRYGYESVGGEVTYSGMDHKEFGLGGRYRAEVVYSGEDDTHNPTLTVSQALNFALRAKTPPKGTRLSSEAKSADFRKHITDILTEMLGIGHTKDTLVGNAWIRGVSGGERKRVSIAEVMTTKACVTAWDNSTRGLDASTALDYAKSLRILSDVFETTTFVSLYQAGESIYDLFDKVMVIDEGRMAYFGPASEAREYFVGLGYENVPRQTTADYLTGCTDPHERRFAPGRDASNVPVTSEQLEEAFRSSPQYTSMLEDLRDYKDDLETELPVTRPAFAMSTQAQKRRFVPRDSATQISFFSQVWALVIRQILLKGQDKLGILSAYGTSTIIAAITGTLFYKLELNTIQGAYRGGVLYLGLTYIAFQAFAEIAGQMMARPVLWKETGYAFYRPSAYAVAQIVADIPFSFVQILIFDSLIYFLAGLSPSGGAFMTFFLMVYITYLALSIMFRAMGAAVRSYNMVSRITAGIVALMTLYSGYILPVYKMKRWLVWIYYLNPVGYAFSGTMANEFKRINLACMPGTIAPFFVQTDPTFYPVPNPADPASLVGPNQVCTTAGAIPGQPFVNGSNYLYAKYRWNDDITWRNIFIMAGFCVFFLGVQMLCLEKLKLNLGLPDIKFYKAENEERAHLNRALAARKKAAEAEGTHANLAKLNSSNQPFTWEGVTYDIKVKGQQRRLLNDVNGYVLPGTMTALMGASGAGKTTLLDVLADRKNVGVIGGDICVNGRATRSDFKRGTGYCEQLDVHEPTTTVREALRYSAYLRQPATVSKAEKDAYVEDVLALLELEELADTMIGTAPVGLDVESRKRLTIGVELAAKPQLLLFLDEPTSGLDGQSAYNVVRFLKKLANAGQAILCTIHQPNALLFEHFDRLLLLEHGGKTVYFGPIGEDSVHLREYLAERGAECPPRANPAEFMLEAIGAGTRSRIGERAWSDLYKESDLFARTQQEIREIKATALANTGPEGKVSTSQFQTSFFTQLRLITYRTFVAQWRTPAYNTTRIFNQFIIALCTGITFMNLGNSYSDLEARLFAGFISVTIPGILLGQTQLAFIGARETFSREWASNTYSVWVFTLSQIIVEIPYNIITATVFFVTWYFPMGFYTQADRAGYQYLMIMCMEFFASSIGQAIAAIVPSLMAGAILNPFILVFFGHFCGITIAFSQMPKYWHWAYYINPFSKILQGIIATEIQGREIVCKPDETFNFPPPAGMTCEQWTTPFLGTYGGMILDPSSTTLCEYCQITSGDVYLAAQEVKFSERWINLGYMAVYPLFNYLVIILGGRFCRFYSR